MHNKYLKRSVTLINFLKFSSKSKSYRTNTKEVELSSYLTPANSTDKKKTLVFLHGLFGSSNNWRYLSYSEAIKNRRNSLLIDLRNHGDSDHHDSMTYNEMADDVIRHLDNLKIEKFTLLGHSMGAKTSMHISTKVKDRLDGLIIVDAAPKCHREDINIYGNTQGIVDAVSTFDLIDKTRRQVVDKFRENFGGPVANLLSTNLTYIDSDSQKIAWRVNVKSIKNNYYNIIGYDNQGTYEGNIMVLQGEKSHRWELNTFKKTFPQIKQEDIKVVEKAGHWVHADNPDRTLHFIGQFLEKIDSIKL